MGKEAWKAGGTKCLSKPNCTPKQVIEVARSLLQPQTTPPGAAAAGLAPAQSDSDAAFQAELRQSFLQTMPATPTASRTALHALAKNHNESTRRTSVRESVSHIS